MRDPVLQTYLDELKMEFDSETDAIHYLISSHRHLRIYKDMVWKTCNNMPKWKERIAKILGFFPFD